MLYVNTPEQALELCRALGSEIRMEIVRLLLDGRHMSMNEIASALGITGGALTGHIKKLEECGILTVESDPAAHGNQKACSIDVTRILIDLPTPAQEVSGYRAQLKVGHYSDCSITPTCGIATQKALIGEVDDPRYFAHPDRFDASILWFTQGYVEYMIPNLVPPNKRLRQLSISAELSSEAPGVNNVWPSDILFSLDGIALGHWTSPGDFGDRRGCFTPDWWPAGWNQYGLLKRLTVDHTGSYIDGVKMSKVSINDLAPGSKAGFRLRLTVSDSSRRAGGLTIFGEGFGNYNQNIDVQVSCGPISP